ncbi:reverse transcriptase (RNA-dependent DNA polymerase) [Hirsutella rhossiliensis]
MSREEFSAAAAPVLFRDRYPLPLIAETLQNLAKAKWFTKLDVVAAFHKIRMAPGHEWKTAFRTSVLREWLDDFVTAYLDDVLIYSSGSKADHEAKVRKVLQALADAGLHLDPAKCEFSVQEVKYLGFIVNAGKGIACDPEKQHAIREWEAPTTVKGVRSFLGFANYYRIFIPDYAKITQPLDALLKKGTAFCYALGGVLAQEDQDGRRHACAFFSKRLSPAEYNYPIHDKEMLAIMRCLDNWSAELRSCGSFTILTDHRNLEYFMTRQKLTERQSRWAAELSQFDFKLEYRPGSEAVVPDALSRREQDKPQGIDDEREQGRMIQLIPDDAIPATTRARINAASSNFSEPFVLPEMKIFEEADLQQLWDETAEKDPIFKEAYRAVQNCERTFPPALGLKVQISECAIDAGKRLTFRDRIWVPGGSGERGSREEAEKDQLRTRIVQQSHDSVSTGHPGREGTLAIVARRFYWPGQSQLVRRFVANCDTCGRAHIWRQSKRGFLKPLPIPDRPRSHLSMDFITDLPPTGPSKARHLWVIVDRLTKAVTLEVMDNMEAEPCAKRFLQCHYRFHGMPRSIVSDRGSNWLKRMNQEIEAYLRAYVSYVQDDWGELLPAAQLALNNRESATTKISPFFAEHGYHVDPISVEESEEPPRDREESRADGLLSRLQEVNGYMQAVMAASQQQQEEAANAKRQPAERFEVGDKVWLSMANYRSPRPCKKLDWLHHKYTVTKVISSHVVELDVRGSIYPRFHVDDAQPPPVQDETGADLWDVDEILCARWKKRGRGEFRQALVRWTGYAEPTWEPERYETLAGKQEPADADLVGGEKGG